MRNILGNSLLIWAIVGWISSCTKDAQQKSIPETIRKEGPVAENSQANAKNPTPSGSIEPTQMDHSRMNSEGMDHSKMDHSKMNHGEVKSGSPEEKSKSKGDRKILFYRNPMRSDIISKVPAKDEMGMDYIPVYEDEVEEENRESADTQSNHEEGVTGRAGVKLNRESRQLIGVTHEMVRVQNLRREIQVTGRVAYDPDLFAAVEELRQAQDLGGAAGRSLVSSTRTKLRLMGLSEEKIRVLAKGGQTIEDLLLPKGKVWIFAEVFEYEVSGIKSGQRVEATAPSLPGEKFEGAITSVSSVLNAPTRTVRVQAEVPDPKKLLRPDNFLNVKIIVELGKKLALPVSAVLYSNHESFVFVVSGKGNYEPRKVIIGEKAGDYYQVLSGLKEGEDVVTSANFLIDSESQLRAVLKKAMSQGQQGDGQ